jgi:hypothetical protein
MDVDTLIRAVQTELQRAANRSAGRKGVIVSGCPACKKQFQSLNQFVTHLREDVIPDTIRKTAATQHLG